MPHPDPATPARLRDLLETAAAVVEEEVAVERRHEDVVAAVVVVVGDGGAHPVEDPLEARLARDVAEAGKARRVVALVAVERERGLLGRRPRGSPGQCAPETKSRSGRPSPS